MALGTAFAIVQPRDAGFPIALGFGLGGASLIAGILSMALNGTSVDFE